MGRKISVRRGFTLIELLVVISIIGILSTLAVVSLNSARQKARDAKRISDVKQLQTALELYFGDQSGYPSVGTAATLGSGGYVCFDEDGFGATCDLSGTTYMGLVPSAPVPPAGDMYAYCSTTAAAPMTCAASTDSYMITFTLEGVTGGLPAGSRVATPAGFQ